MKGTVRVAVLAAAIAVAILLIAPLVPLIGPSEPAGQPLHARDSLLQDAEVGPQMAVPAAEHGLVAPATFDGTPVLVFVVETSFLDAVEAQRGHVVESIAHPASKDHRIFAVSAYSTHLGCTVDWVPGPGAGRDVRDYDADGQADGQILDICHHGQWDAYAGGVAVPGTAAPSDLAVLFLDLRMGQEDPVLYGTHFDGPVGPQR